ncbi:secretin N-terminal domain-containing protein [Planctomycetota bacterium]
MKIRTLIVSILGVLVVSGASLAQAVEAPEQEPQEPAFQQSDSPPLLQTEPSLVAQATPAPTQQVQRSRRRTVEPVATPPSMTAQPASSPKQLRIFELKYADARELASLIGNLTRISVQVDYRLNRLIVNTTEEQLVGVENLINAMDVDAPEASTSLDIQNLVYRIYMFEIASEDKGMKPFSMILQTSAHVSSQELMDAVADKDLQIGEFLQSEGRPEPQAEILIQGKAVSNESLRRMVEKFPESNILELKWDDDETFTNNIAAAQHSQLPEQMQKHIGKFLGDEIQTVGYWFGNLSVPGEVQAPIGPWALRLQLDTESDRMLELNINVEIPGEMNHFYRRLGRDQNNEILSNTIRAKIGKSIIIGYNRESYGTRKMGAMVIVPEADPI